MVIESEALGAAALFIVDPLVVESGGGSVFSSPREAVSRELGRADRPLASRSTVERVAIPDAEPEQLGGKFPDDSSSRSASDRREPVITIGVVDYLKQ